MGFSCAILLDGGFIKRKLRGAQSHGAPGAADIEAFVQRAQKLPMLQGMRLHRIYFYDAQPLQGEVQRPLEGGVENFGTSSTARRNNELHAQLGRLDYFALRFGELAHNGWQLDRKVLRSKGGAVEITSADIKPNIQQKGVDMRIGLDIASLTLKKQAQVIVLVTGDSDFIPAMKFARREGAQLVLITMGHGIKAAMFDHADVVIESI